MGGTKNMKRKHSVATTGIQIPEGDREIKLAIQQRLNNESHVRTRDGLGFRNYLDVLSLANEERDCSAVLEKEQSSQRKHKIIFKEELYDSLHNVHDAEHNVMVVWKKKGQYHNLERPIHNVKEIEERKLEQLAMNNLVKMACKKLTVTTERFHPKYFLPIFLYGSLRKLENGGTFVRSWKKCLLKMGKVLKK